MSKARELLHQGCIRKVLGLEMVNMHQSCLRWWRTAGTLSKVTHLYQAAHSRLLRLYNYWKRKQTGLDICKSSVSACSAANGIAM